MPKGAFHLTTKTDFIYKEDISEELKYEKVPNKFKVFKYLSIYHEHIFDIGKLEIKATLAWICSLHK